MNEPRAAGASDFVDRLIGKALGAADVATARVPSAFEPIQPRGATGFPASPADRTDARDTQSFALTRRRLPTAGAAGSTGMPSALPGVDEGASPSVPAAGTAASAHARANAATDAAGAGSAWANDKASAGALAARGLRAGEPAGLQRTDRHHDETVGGDTVASAIAGAPRGTPARWGALGRIAASTPEAATAGAFGHARDRGHGGENGAAGDLDAWLLASSGLSPAAVAAAVAAVGRAAGAHVSGASDDLGEGVLVPRVRGIVGRLMSEGAARRGPEAMSLAAGNDVSGAEPEITVNVTIGRVDVRAMQAPASREKRSARAAGPQPVSLDEYLGHRGGGR